MLFIVINIGSTVRVESTSGSCEPIGELWNNVSHAANRNGSVMLTWAAEYLQPPLSVMLTVLEVCKVYY